MTPDDKPMFVAALTELAALKPGAKLSPETYGAWWNAMQDWDLADFRAACAQLAKTSEFMPNPFHFEQLRKAGRKTAGEAWAEVLHYVRYGYSRVGVWFNGSPKPTDPLLLSAVRAIGGWDAIAMSPTDQTRFLERRFAEHYEQIQEHEEVREALPHLTMVKGLVDHTKAPR
jgi:hypothetical protein